MPTTNMTCITDAGGFARYILSPKKDKDGKESDIATRILCIGGTMVAEPAIENIQDLRNEFAIHAGRRYDGNAVRISLAEDEHLTQEQWQSFIADVMEEYLPNRPYLYAVHHDGSNQVEHCHIIGTFLDADGNYLKFAGHRNSEREAIRQQAIIDKIALKYGLKILSRPAGSYRKKEPNDADTRQTIAMRQRLQDADAILWLDVLKKDFRQACQNSRTADEVFQRLAEKGWTISRETPKHITLSNGIYKCRLARMDRNLPNRQSLQDYLDRRNQAKPIITPTASPITPCGRFGASAGTAGVAGNAVADEHATEDE